MLRHEEFVAEDRKDYEALAFNEAVICMKMGRVFCGVPAFPSSARLSIRTGSRQSCTDTDKRGALPRLGERASLHITR